VDLNEPATRLYRTIDRFFVQSEFCPLQIAPFPGATGSPVHLIHGSFNPLVSSDYILQTASRSVLPVFVGLAVVTNRRTHRQTETHTDHATSITCSDAPCMCCGPQQLGAQTDIPVCHCNPHHCRHRQLLSLVTTTYLQSSHNHPTFISA